MITAIQIIKQYLIEHSYDGLYCHDCGGCFLADLAPCGEILRRCRPGVELGCRCGPPHAGCGCLPYIGARPGRAGDSPLPDVTPAATAANPAPQSMREKLHAAAKRWLGRS